jgi:[NiFe] hydrogenase assembly HybE family chaperone
MRPSPVPVALGPRVAALVALYERIGRTRMAGLPLLHGGLSVQAEGFAAEADGHVALGVLVTPWFMNLVRLPLNEGAALAAPGASRRRAVGAHAFDFIGAFEPGFGALEACSLFSPMFEFADQAAAVATARAVLDTLRRDAAPAPLAARRALLFGAAPGRAR